MKILLIAFDYRPRLGGVATCSFELAKALHQKEGIQVQVLAPKMKDDKAFDQKYKFSVARIDLPTRAIMSIFFELKAIKDIVNETRPDLIINMLWMPSGISSLLYSLFFNSKKISYYVVAHGVEVIESNFTIKKRIRSFLSPLKKLVFKRAEGVFSVSQYTSNILLNKCKVKKKKLHTVFNGVDPEYFVKKQKQKSLIEKYNIENKKVLLTITRLDDYKGVDNAIIAFSKIKELKNEYIYLVGGVGQDYNRLDALLEEHNLKENIILCGRISDEELIDYYNLADVFVLLSRFDPYTPNFEGFGLVFLEAAACGIPSLAGDSGGIPDAVIHEETGVLVNPIDTNEIAKALTKLIKNNDYRKNLGENAYKRATTDMTWDNMANRILKALQ